MIAYLILGLPEDDLKQMLDDILFLAALPVIIGPSLFYPPPRSATFQNCVRENFISGYDFALYRSTAIPVETNNFSRGEIITLFRLVRLINYMKQKPELLKTNFLSKHPKKSAKANSLTFEHKLNQEEIGKLIIDQLAQNKNFRGLALKAKNGTTFQYQWLNYFCSQKIVAEFLSKLKGLPMKIE